MPTNMTAHIIHKGKNMKKAQAALEYFIIFAVIASLCLISLPYFLPKVRTSSQGLFINAVNRILLADKRIPIIPPPPPGTLPPGAILINQHCYFCGEYFGITNDGYSPGTHKTYYLPLGELSKGQSISMLELLTVSPLANYDPDVDITLTSPSGEVFTSSDGGYSLRAQSYGQYINYQKPYIEDGYWKLDIVAKDSGQLNIYYRILGAKSNWWIT